MGSAIITCWLSGIQFIGHEVSRTMGANVTGSANNLAHFPTTTGAWMHSWLLRAYAWPQLGRSCALCSQPGNISDNACVVHSRPGRTHVNLSSRCMCTFCKRLPTDWGSFPGWPWRVHVCPFHRPEAEEHVCTLQSAGKGLHDLPWRWGNMYVFLTVSQAPCPTSLKRHMLTPTPLLAECTCALHRWPGGVCTWWSHDAMWHCDVMLSMGHRTSSVWPCLHYIQHQFGADCNSAQGKGNCFPLLQVELQQP